jgi:hypothetical protein
MRLLCLCLLTILLAACGAEAGITPLIPGETLITYDFETTRLPPRSINGDQALFRPLDGELEAAVIADRGYIWYLTGETYADLALRVTVRQTEGAVDGQGFGLMCRADDMGNGYYFVIAASGHAAVLKATPDNPDPQPLQRWGAFEAVRQGREIVNELTVICAGDHLRFIVNGQIIADLRDSTYAEGQVGLVLGATAETLWLRFDDLQVRSAAVGEG